MPRISSRDLPMTSNQVAAAALAAVAAAVFWHVRGLPFGSLTSPGPAYLPVMLACALLAFSAPVAIFGGEQGILPDRHGIRKCIAIAACCAFAFFAMDSLGYRATVAIGVIFLLGAIEGRHPIAAFTSAGLVSFGSYYLLQHTLNVPLPRGFWNF
jgi:hypothetical protein